MPHGRKHHYAIATEELDDSDDLDFSSHSSGLVADDIPVEPVQYMKHGKQRHKDILAKRGFKVGGDEKSARKAKKQKLADDPEATRRKAKKAAKENPEAAKKAKRAAKRIAPALAQTDTEMGRELRRAGEMEAERD